MPKPVDVTTPSDREIMRDPRASTRRAELVWDAHTKPELLRRWLVGPPGWTMPTAPSTCGSAASTAMSGARTRTGPSSDRTASTPRSSILSGSGRPSGWTASMAR